jgi:hypothetical protein
MNYNEQNKVVRHIGISSISYGKPEQSKQVSVPSLPDFTYDYILSLPSVSFSDRMLLPHEQGLYFVYINNTNLDKPIYVGASVNFCQRFKTHNNLFALEFLDALELSIRIAYLSLPAWLRVDIEALEISLIRKFNPRMNKTGKKLEDSSDIVANYKKPTKVRYQLSDESKNNVALRIDKPLEMITVNRLRAIGKELSIEFASNTPKKAMCDSIKDVLGKLYSESRFGEDSLSIEQIVHKPRVKKYISRETVLKVFDFWKAEKKP